MALLDQFGNALRATAGTLTLPARLAAKRARREVIQKQEAERQLWRGFDLAPPLSDVSSWQAKLDELAPRDGQHSWLKLAWHPGYPWAPVRRWVIYQMAERHVIPTPALACLEGPDPRTLGYWDPQKQEYISAARVTRYQWDLYRETGCFGRTYWIIQGSHGGHRAQFTQAESAISRMNGGPAQPPDPGALPYAPFDGRVTAQLESYMRIQSYVNNGAALERSEKEAERKLKAMVGEWIGKQVQDAIEPHMGELENLTRSADAPRSTLSLAQLEDERARALEEED